MDQNNWIDALREEHLAKVHVKRDPLFKKKVRLGNTGFNGVIKADLVYARNNLLGSMEVTAAALYGNEEYSPEKHQLLKCDVAFTSSTSEAVQGAANKLANEMQAHLDESMPSHLKGEPRRVAALNSFVRYIEDSVLSVGAKNVSVEHTPSWMTSRRTGVPQPRKNKQSSYQGKVKPLVETLPPCLLRDELQAHGQLKVDKTSSHASGRLNYHISFPNAPESGSTSISMYVQPTPTSAGLRSMLQSSSTPLNTPRDFLKYCLETGKVFNGQGLNTPEEVLNFLAQNRKTRSYWSAYEGVEIGADVFRGLDEWGIARQPLSKLSRDETVKQAKECLSDWRKVPMELIDHMIDAGQLASHTFHYVKSNRINDQGSYYKLKKVSPDSPLTAPHGDYHERYQNLFKTHDDIGGKKTLKLAKVNIGKNKGYFFGHPKVGTDSLILTESILDSNSIKVMANYAQKMGVNVEDNTISLLSTVGLLDFIKQRFHIEVRTRPRSDDVQLKYTHPLDVDSRGELLTADQKEHFARVLFERKTVYVDDGTAYSQKMYRALISLGEAVGQNEVNIPKITSGEQESAIKAEPSQDLGGALFMDASAFSDLIKSCHLRADSVNNELSWRSVMPRWSKWVPFEKMTQEQRANLKKRVDYQMNEVLQVKSITSGFDNDSGGLKATLILKTVCEALSIPFHDATLPKIKVDKGVLNEGKRFGITEDHNDFLMAIENAKESEDKELAKSLLSEWANVMPKVTIEQKPSLSKNKESLNDEQIVQPKR